MSFRPRIAVAVRVSADYTPIADWLAPEGFEPIRLSSQATLSPDLTSQAFDLLVVDAALATPAINAVRARRPLIPIVVVGDADPIAESQAMARGAVYLSRPIDRALFVCSIAMAVMESRPTRRSERKRARLSVIAHGVASLMIDVSREGLRLEIPRGLRTAPPPPLFDVTVPMLGVALSVRRLWTASPPQPGHAAIWYGGELANNSRRVELAWLTLVDALPASQASLEVQ